VTEAFAYSAVQALLLPLQVSSTSQI